MGPDGGNRPLCLARRGCTRGLCCPPVTSKSPEGDESGRPGAPLPLCSFSESTGHQPSRRQDWQGGATSIPPHWPTEPPAEFAGQPGSLLHPIDTPESSCRASSHLATAPSKSRPSRGSCWSTLSPAHDAVTDPRDLWHGSPRGGDETSGPLVPAPHLSVCGGRCWLTQD